MIKVRKYNALKDALLDAYVNFDEQILGYPYDAEKQNFIFHTNLVEEFQEEFQECILNTLPDKDKLKSYIEEVYYNGIMRYFIFFNNLCKSYAERHNSDYILLGQDNIFTRLYNGYREALSSLASTIRTEATKHQIITLDTKISLDDYNITGQYIPLFQKSTSSNRNSNPLSFNSYLSEKGEKALPTLIMLFKDEGPKVIAQALWAMSDLGYLNVELGIIQNKTQFANSIKAIFGKVSRSQLFEMIGKYENPKAEDSIEIIEQKKKIAQSTKDQTTIK